MRFSSLGSGSRGNAALVEASTTCLMIDCGFSIKETERRLARLGKTPKDIDALLVTHEHSDHIQGVSRLAKRFEIPVWMTPGTHQSSAFQSKKIKGSAQPLLFDAHTPFAINDIEVHPFPVPHDASEPSQFVFYDGESRVAILTDTGSITPHIKTMLSGVDALMLEFNHDVDMLWQGKYPDSLKQRISCDYGHMSNEQAATLLRQIDCKNLQSVAAMHLSSDNNSPDFVYQELEVALGVGQSTMEIADQEHGLAWREIESI